jgi:hypothetical protein
MLARRASSLTLTFLHLQEPSSQPKQPVEFDQAINYVNKIKVTAAGTGVGGMISFRRLSQQQALAGAACWCRSSNTELIRQLYAQ